MRKKKYERMRDEKMQNRTEKRFSKKDQKNNNFYN